MSRDSTSHRPAGARRRAEVTATPHTDNSPPRTDRWSAVNRGERLGDDPRPNDTRPPRVGWPLVSPGLGQRILRSIATARTYLYQWNVGWLLGSRFLRLTHVGRRSGRQYQTVLEVVGEDPGRQEIMVVAGLGRSAQWYRNVRAGNAVAITIGRRYFHPVYRELGVREAASVVGAYEQRNRWAAPFVRRLLSSLVGWRYDGTERARQKLVAQLPVIAFRPGPQGNVRPAAVQYDRLAEPTGTCLPIPHECAHDRQHPNQCCCNREASLGWFPGIATKGPANAASSRQTPRSLHAGRGCCADSLTRR